MTQHRRPGRQARLRRQASAQERLDPERPAQRWTCGHKHGLFIFASRCGLNNAPVSSPEERLLREVFGG
jgi:hypothetical protein